MKYPAEVLTREEVGALLKVCGKEKWTDRRNYALIVLLYRSGLRIGEALALRPCDMDLQRGVIRVLHGKCDRARSVGVDCFCRDAMGEWIHEHSNLGGSNGGPLFHTKSMRPLSQGYLRRKFPELGRAAGIHKRLHAHSFRHTFASELRDECVDIGIISKLLGHSSLETTIKYLDHLTNKEAVEFLRGRSKCLIF